MNCAELVFAAQSIHCCMNPGSRLVLRGVRQISPSHLRRSTQRNQDIERNRRSWKLGNQHAGFSPFKNWRLSSLITLLRRPPSRGESSAKRAHGLRGFESRVLVVKLCLKSNVQRCTKVANGTAMCYLLARAWRHSTASTPPADRARSAKLVM